MAKCENCNQDKRHTNSTYFQMLRPDGKRELPPEATRKSSNWMLLDAFYYCHECIRNHWYVRKDIERTMNRDDVEFKIMREIPEMASVDKGDTTIA